MSGESLGIVIPMPIHKEPTSHNSYDSRVEAQLYSLKLYRPLDSVVASDWSIPLTTFNLFLQRTRHPCPVLYRLSSAA